jgi:hypothetical protein
MKEQIIPNGEKLFHLDYGFIEVSNYKDGFYYFRNNEVHIHENSKYLSLTEYDLYNGGFTPLSDYNKPKVGDFGYFWDNEQDRTLLYGQLFNLEEKEGFKYIDVDNSPFKFFSKEIPEWFKNKMNEEDTNQ